MDTSRFQETFGPLPTTPHRQAVAETWTGSAATPASLEFHAWT